MAGSVSGQAAWFSATKQGFDSPTRYSIGSAVRFHTGFHTGLIMRC
jgi:hypothetical protein